MQDVYKHLNVVYGNVYVNDLEASTRLQSESQEWFTARRNRLTASNFGLVMKRKAPVNEKFLCNLFSDGPISAAAIEHGNRNESRARDLYVRQRSPSLHTHACGFVVNEQFMFLGASPDGKVCQDSQCGIIEIKCPYKARNMTVSEAVTTLQPDFMLDDGMDLKKTHNYYAQVQGQLMITGAPFCDFIVFTYKDLFVIRVLPDQDYMVTLLNKLCAFFENHAMPYLKNLNRLWSSYSTEIILLKTISSRTCRNSCCFQWYATDTRVKHV